MILDEINKKEDSAFDLGKYMTRIKINLLELCLIKGESPDELEHEIKKFKLIGDSPYNKREYVIKAITEGCKFFKIKDYDAFYSRKIITTEDIVAFIKKLEQETIDGRLVWRKSSASIYKTNDYEFFSKAKSQLTIKKLVCRDKRDKDIYDILGEYSIEFKGKYKACDCPKISFDRIYNGQEVVDELGELYQIIVDACRE